AKLNLQAPGAAARNSLFGSHMATIEIGVKVRTAHKFDNTFRDRFTPTGAPILLSAFPSRFSNSDYYSANYKLGPNRSFQDVFAALNASTFTMTSTAGGNDANFDQIGRASCRERV